MSVIIRLQGLPLSAVSADIRNFFCDVRIPDGAVNIVGGEEGDAFIAFATDDDARKAMRSNHGMIHNSEIQLFLSSRNEMKEVVENARSALPMPIDPPFVPPRSGGTMSASRFEIEEPSRVTPAVDTRFDEKGVNEGAGMKSYTDRTQFDIQGMRGSSEKTDEHNKSDDVVGGKNVRMQSIKQLMNPVADFRYQEYAGNMRTLCTSERIDGDIRLPNVHRESANKEESWRSENILSCERVPRLLGSNGPQWMGRGVGGVPKRPLLPSPSVSSPQVLSNPTHSYVVPIEKEEAYVELTRLPSHMLLPSVLEQFLAPTTPLTLSSVKVVYSPEGIHLHSLVRFTRAMDAINVLQRDGEQGVKIRPSTKERFECAREGPPVPPVPPFPYPLLSSVPHFTPPMAGMQIGGERRLNPCNIPIINPNQVMGGGDRRGQDEETGEKRRREDILPRGRRRSVSPRSKRWRGDARVCVHTSNLPFRAKEIEIRRMMGPLNPFSIKKVFNEDNAPSDVWIIEFASEAEAMEAIQRRLELGGRQARMKIIVDTEADILLKQKFISPPRRRDRRDSFDEKVRMQQEAIELEKASQYIGSENCLSGERALAGAFSAPVFTRNRGFMRGGRGGGGRGMRGGIVTQVTRGMIGEKNCVLVKVQPPLPPPQVLLEHLRVIPSLFVRVDQIAPDAAVLEVKGEKDALRVLENAHSSPYINGRRIVVSVNTRRKIEEDFNLIGRESTHYSLSSTVHSLHFDPHMERSVGDVGCVFDEVKRF